MKESLTLLSRRERREVLGHRYANLWLLTIVIAATFLSIAFSNASMGYLAEKMDDPFTNWVNIKFAGEIPDSLIADIDDPETLRRFRVKDYSTDYANDYVYYNARGQNSEFIALRAMQSLSGDLVTAILNPDNVVYGTGEEMPAETFGAIITAEALQRMGYTPEAPPAFVNKAGYSVGADTLGIALTDGKYAPAPQPVLAVVRRLPGNIDMITTALFYDQEASNPSIMNLNNPEYVQTLYYYVPEEMVDDFQAHIADAMPDSARNDVALYPIDDRMQAMRPARPGRFFQVSPLGYRRPASVDEYNSFAERIARQWPAADTGIERVWQYDVRSSLSQSFKDYLSFNFERLDSIRPFEQYMRKKGIKIDMATVNAKENFSAVSVMANILSWAMILFSVVCIILFIVNMLQSYFQKVKRNMGTFKAFGISTAELIGVYVAMLFRIVVTAIALGLLAAWLLQMLLPLLGLLKDGRYPYLDLWSMKTLLSALTMVLATALTVFLVMRSLLRRTPGDLIYDR